MATLVLGAVGSAIGGAFGGAILGFSGAAIGALPPSSRWVRLMVLVAASMILRPVAMSPVMEIIATAG